jgi:toxin ParE1/3/4
MKEYSVKVTTSAEMQMEQISLYIAYDLENPEAALTLLNTLELSISKLSTLPHRFALIDKEPWRSKGIRVMPVKNYFVYYWISEEENKVQVTAVIYQKREQKRQLSQMDME